MRLRKGRGNDKRAIELNMPLIKWPISLTPNIILNDAQLIKMWIHSHAITTRKAYIREAQLFIKFVAKPLPAVTISDVQSYVDSLNDRLLAPATIARALNSIKSLLTFGYKLNYLPTNAGSSENSPKVRNSTSERILSPIQVNRMIALETSDRNRAILLLLYSAGLRVSELSGLKWRDIAPRGDRAQLTVFGKGGKTRFVLIPTSVWIELQTLVKGEVQPDAPLFVSKKRGHLTPAQIWVIVRAAAKKAGIKNNVSPHWLRHAYASHSLDRGCPLSLLQQSLGHSSAATTSRYLHARPDDSAGLYLGL